MNRLQIGQDVVPWDPSAGIELAFLLIVGVRYAPVVFVAVVISDVAHTWLHHPGVPLSLDTIAAKVWTSTPHSLAVAVVYAAGALLLRRGVRFDLGFGTPRDAPWYVLVALFVPAPLAAITAYTHLRVNEITPQSAMPAAFQFWVVDAIGIMTAGPAMLLAAAAWRRRSLLSDPPGTLFDDSVLFGDLGASDSQGEKLSKRRGKWWSGNRLEGPAQIGSLAVAIWVSFFGPWQAIIHSKFLIVLPLVWIIMRRGLSGGVVCWLAVNAALMACAWLARLDGNQIVDLQVFMVVASASTLLLGSLASSRRRTERQLAASEERYRLLFENSPHPMWVYDRSTLRFLDVNQAAVGQYGYTRAEFLGLTLKDIRPPQDAASVHAAATNTGTTSINRAGVWRHKRKDGTLLDVDIASSQMPLLGPNARLVLARDVTQSLRTEQARQKAEASLRDALQRLVSLVDNSPMAVIEWDRAFNIVRWSGEAQRIFGWAAPEVLAKNPFAFKFVYEPDALAVRRAMAHLGDGQPRVTLNNRNYTKAGAILHCEWHNSVIWDEAGNIISILSLVCDATARVEAQTALLRNEQRFELVVRGANDGVWDWDLATGELYLSPRYRELIGDDDRPTVAGIEAWESHIFPDDRAMVLAAVNDHLEEGAPFDIEYRLRGLEGAVRWFRGRGQAVWDENGRPLRMAGSISDITDRRIAQQLLRETAEKYCSLVETTRTGYAVFDERGRVIDANAEYVRLAGRATLAEVLGRSPDEWSGQPGLSPPQFTGHDLIEQAILAGQARALETQYIGPAGKVTPVEMNATAVTTAQGVRLLALVRDISHRKRAEAAVVELKNRYEAAAAASRQFVYELDYETGDIRWGADTTALLGSGPSLLSRIELWIQRIHPDDRRAYDLARQRLTADRGNFHLEYRVRDHDGLYIHVEDTARFHADALGRTSRMVGFVADVTERVRGREELARHAAELARSNAELERFAYVASHDLQEPLRMVTSFTRLLAERYKGRLDKDADEFIGFAVEGATRMRCLVDDLLAYSRVSSTPRTMIEVDANAAVERALRNLKVTIDEAGAAVEVTPLPTVTADELQLTLLFQNLIANAVKFRGPLPPVLKISAAKDNGAWRFSVEDNGIGIEPKHRERVFQMFQRLHSRSRFAGNGIGLTICKRIVEDMGGSIEIQDAVGNGCVFSFTVPTKL